jgi:hypothetical protein
MEQEALEVITTSLALLRAQFPEMGGLSNPSMDALGTDVKGMKNLQNLRDRKFSSLPGKRQTHLIWVSVGRWVVASNIFGESESDVVVYDSAGQLQLGLFEHKVAAAFRLSNTDQIFTICPPVQKQPSSDDSGVIAIAHCVALAFSIDPRQLNLDFEVGFSFLVIGVSGIIFDKFQEMHIHLSNCRLEGVFSPFPVLPGNPKILSAGGNWHGNAKIACACLMPVIVPELTMMCANEACQYKKFHCSCVRRHKFSGSQPRSNVWVCPFCKIAGN